MKDSPLNSGSAVEGIIKITSKGFGYVLPPESEESIEIAPEFINRALHGDMVKALITGQKPDGQHQGEVQEVIKRTKTEFVGVLEDDKGTLYLIPDDRRMYADIKIVKPISPSLKVNPGDKVLVGMIDWPEGSRGPNGEVIDVIGTPGLHETEMRAIVMERGFKMSFPSKVEAEAEVIGKNAAAHIAEEAKNRRDFRPTFTCTIDPADAKDFDDALSVKILDNGDYEIGVHIADVSHYVRPGTALDTEARKRATSIYLVDRTIPMLPEVLSNNVCSLVPHEDRLTFAAVFVMDKKGKIKEEWIGRTIINSTRRFAYEEVQKILDDGEGEHKEELFILRDLARILREEKFENGAIAFEDSEVKFKLDENGKPIEVYKKERTESHLLIEDFMLLANRRTAEYASRLNKNADHMFVYRIHDFPNIEKLQNLQHFLAPLGYKLGIEDDKISPTELTKLLVAAKGKPEEDIVNRAAVRAMAKAVYSTANIGHWGLAFPHYTHFTSPIRRYPDVLVHRLLAIYLSGTKPSPEMLAETAELLIHSTDMEIKAADAERDSIRYKQIEYMGERIGTVFSGVISGIAEWGLFVEENETKTEGLVRLGSLGDDFYEYDEKQFALIGQRSGKKFHLGDKVRMKLIGADLKKKTIDYEFVK